MDGAYHSEWHGLKVKYQLTNEEDANYAQLGLLHRRPLNLGMHLSDKKESAFVARLTALQSKPIDLPTNLAEKGIKCLVADESVGKLLVSSDKATTAILELDELVKSYKGDFVIDDTMVKMKFPYGTLFDKTILESADHVSSAFTASIMLPAAPPRRVLIQKRIFNAIVFLLILGFILTIIWAIFTEIGK